MARSLKIHLVTPTPDLVHQWRNFGEDVYRALRDECEVSIEEIDASTSEFFVHGIRKRRLRSIVVIIRKITQEHLMSHLIEVDQMTDDPTA